MSDETIRLVALNPADYKSTTVSLPKPPRDRSRFAVLLLLVFIPFGGHFFKAAQSAMQPLAQSAQPQVSAQLLCAPQPTAQALRQRSRASARRKA